MRLFVLMIEAKTCKISVDLGSQVRRGSVELQQPSASNSVNYALPGQ